MVFIPHQLQTLWCCPNSSWFTPEVQVEADMPQFLCLSSTRFLLPHLRRFLICAFITVSPLMACQFLQPAQILLDRGCSWHTPTIMWTWASETSSNFIHCLSLETQCVASVHDGLMYACDTFMNWFPTEHLLVQKSTPFWSMWEDTVGYRKQILT